METLGPGEGEVREVRLFNRVVQYCPEGVRLEADPRHVEAVVRELCFVGGKEVASPGDKDQFKNDEADHGTVELEPSEATQYRARVARLNYVCSERPDAQHAVKELARGMATPTTLCMFKLKRLARCLRGRPRLQLVYEWQAATGEMNVCADSDYAGDTEARRSTSTGIHAYNIPMQTLGK